jgi:hypothetical protein
MSVDKTSQAYRDGFNAEGRRIAARDTRRAALDAHPNLTDIAREVGKQLGRDNVRKQRIVQRSPHVFAAMDAQELGAASGRELAVKELRELGIEIGADYDPVMALDMFHQGRAHAARDFKIPGNKLTGGNTIQGNNGIPIVGSGGVGTQEDQRQQRLNIAETKSHDSRESWLDSYLKE